MATGGGVHIPWDLIARGVYKKNIYGNLLNVYEFTIRLSYNFLKYDYDKNKFYKPCVILLINFQKATGESGAIQDTCGIYTLHLIKNKIYNNEIFLIFISW